jgi:hypothetical protein
MGTYSLLPRAELSRFRRGIMDNREFPSQEVTFRATVSTTVTITSCQSGTSVTADVVELMPDVANWMEDNWWSRVGAVKSPLDCEGDCHWRWPTMIQFGSTFKDALAVRTPDGDIQGAAIYNTSGRSYLGGEGAVYVEYLAAAPWNRGRLAVNPVYCGVGKNLMFQMVCQSYNLGLAGRVTLQSLPSAVGYYTNLGFVPTGPEENGIIPCELPAEKAEKAANWLGQT